MSIVGQIHLAASVFALASGAAVLLMRGKGGRRHRQVGWVYAGSMLAVNVTAFMIYRLFGGFGPFHAAALVSLTGLIFGIRAGRQAGEARRRGDYVARATRTEHHYRWMTWSYVGLWAAFASEAITRLPALRPILGGGSMFGIAVGFATFVVVGVGARWINRSATKTLEPFYARATDALRS